MEYLGLRFSENAKEYLRNTLVYPGDKVFYTFHSYGHLSFVCEARVTRVELIMWDGDQTSSSVWVIVDEDGVPTPLDPAIDISNMEIVNLFFMIDEPVGHSVQLDTYDGVFRTLNEALTYVYPWKGCRHHHKKKALQRYRDRMWRGYSMSPWKLPNKKVWVRRK